MYMNECKMIAVYEKSVMKWTVRVYLDSVNHEFYDYLGDYIEVIFTGFAPVTG